MWCARCKTSCRPPRLCSKRRSRLSRIASSLGPCMVRSRSNRRVLAHVDFYTTLPVIATRRPIGTSGVHGDGILVPSPPIPADCTPIPTRPRTDSDQSPPIPAKRSIHPHKSPHIFCQPNNSQHSGNTENTPQHNFNCQFQTVKKHTNLFYETRQKLKAYITDSCLSLSVH